MTQIILAEIRTHTQAVAVDEAAVADRLRRKSAEYDELYFSGIRHEIAKLNRRIQELEGLTAKLYEDKYNGTISESVFTVLMGKNEQERISKEALIKAGKGEVSSQKRRKCQGKERIEGRNPWNSYTSQLKGRKSPMRVGVNRPLWQAYTDLRWRRARVIG